jgi:protein-S-isoprenylcysteine O-methyltransferase Ste14
MVSAMLRHLLSILLLPFMVVAVVPCILLSTFAQADSRWMPESPIAWLTRAGGAAALLLGLALFSWCLYLFARVGQGTLAPWDPTRNLVLIGPYRWVRNPMILGVAMALAGQALLRGSWVLGLWAGAFLLINHAYFVLLEEPGLERRFGEPYRAYKAAVPRWFPRIRPRREDGAGQG